VAQASFEAQFSSLVLTKPGHSRHALPSLRPGRLRVSFSRPALATDPSIDAPYVKDLMTRQLGGARQRSPRS